MELKVSLSWSSELGGGGRIRSWLRLPLEVEYSWRRAKS
jgi:hypothetical protein